MKNSEGLDDEWVKMVLKKGSKPMPNVDFEVNLMQRIYDEANYKKEVAAQLKLSFKIFLSAISVGFILLIIVLFSNSFIESKSLITLALFIISVAGIIKIDNYMRLIRKYS